MWFQDLFNYDFRRTEQCIIPYATQEGEISFCAYNTGVGWRNIIEKMHMTATLTKWYEEHGTARDLRRRQKSEDGRRVQRLPPPARRASHHFELQHDLDNLGASRRTRAKKRRERATREGGCKFPTSRKKTREMGHPRRAVHRRTTKPTTRAWRRCIGKSC